MGKKGAHRDYFNDGMIKVIIYRHQLSTRYYETIIIVIVDWT